MHQVCLSTYVLLANALAVGSITAVVSYVAVKCVAVAIDQFVELVL